jgi:hypothetical protein
VTGPAATPRLARLARGERSEPQADVERCDLCGAPVGERHRHVVDVSTRRLQCVCRACVIVMTPGGAGGGRWRLVPDHVEVLPPVDDDAWAALRIPVDLAFFMLDSRTGAVTAFYPGPLGATESLLPMDAWERVAAADPRIAGLEPDVAAVLVDRTAARCVLVGVDRCYELVGGIRRVWKGIGGGDGVRSEVDAFFAGLGE